MRKKRARQPRNLDSVYHEERKEFKPNLTITPVRLVKPRKRLLGFGLPQAEGFKDEMQEVLLLGAVLSVPPAFVLWWFSGANVFLRDWLLALRVLAGVFLVVVVPGGLMLWQKYKKVI